MISKRGRVWHYKFMFRGQLHRGSTHTGDKRQAKLIESKVRSDLGTGLHGVGPLKTAPKLKDFAQKFLGYTESRGKKDSTLGYYAAKINQLLKYKPFADATIDQIDEEMIETYIEHRRKQRAGYKGKGPKRIGAATINRDLATLQRVLKVAKRLKKISHVPDIEKLSGERKRTFVLSPALEQKYLAAAPQPLRDVALLMIDTGIRPGEALALTWSDVITEKGRTPRIRIVNGKTENAVREIPLTVRAASMLAVRKSESESETIFPGVRVDSLGKASAKVRKAIKGGAELIPYAMRHTMATRADMVGAGRSTSKRLLGHATIQMGDTYIHASVEQAEEVIAAMEKKFTGPLK